MVLLSVMAFLSPDEAGDIMLRRDSKSSNAVGPFVTGDFNALTFYGGGTALKEPAVVNSLMARDLRLFAINSDNSYDYCLTLLRWDGLSAQIIAPYHYQYDENSINDGLVPCSQSGLNSYAANEVSEVFTNMANLPFHFSAQTF